MFETEDDRKAFVFRLGQVCGSHGWRVHAWVLMGNHFHLLLETPQANLVSGMKYLMGTFSQGWNRARRRRGHVFQGRYKAVPVNGSESDAYSFRIVADYIHLNPARAGLAGGAMGPLVRYQWSSLPCLLKGNGPDWLVKDRVLRAFDLARDGRGRRAYVAWLEARAANHEGKIDEAAMQAMRRGWYLGQETFKDRLLKLLDKATGKAASGRSRTGESIRDRGEMEAGRIVRDGLKTLGVPGGKSVLAAMTKSDPRKIVLAALVRANTSVSNAWIAERLAMGHPGSVSRMLATGRSDRKLANQQHELAA
ncbi:MAG: transposase, partial [Verrucomicrobiota bacterium]